MKTINTRFAGGPLDGSTRTEWVLDHWNALRLEHRRHGRLHVYFDEIAGDVARLDYIGCESIAEVPE